MYVLIENQPSSNLQGISIPAFFVVYLPENKEVIPVFLSRVAAYGYMKANKLHKEFKLVSIDDFSLDTYRSICKQGEGSALAPCSLILGLNEKQEFVSSRNPVTLNELFYHRDNVATTLANTLGATYTAIKDGDAEFDEQTLFDNEEKPSFLKTAFKSLFNRENQEKDYTPPNIGQGHLFILKAPDFTFCCTGEGKDRNVALFVNKLDAVMYSLMEREKSNIIYEPVNITKNEMLMNFLKKSYDDGNIKIAVIMGFSGTRTQLGAKWAKSHALSHYPLVQATYTSFEDIQNGFDLAEYFYYVTEKKELEEAIVALVNTNATATSDLVDRATKILEDMKINSIVVSNEDPRTYHRMVFLGA